MRLCARGASAAAAPGGRPVPQRRADGRPAGGVPRLAGALRAGMELTPRLHSLPAAGGLFSRPLAPHAYLGGGASICLHPREDRVLRDWKENAPQDLPPAGSLEERVRAWRHEAARATADRLGGGGGTLPRGGRPIEGI